MKALLTLVFLFFSGFITATSLKNIVVFGDSLSDNGNLYKYTDRQLPPSPPYYDGRFTNGTVWVERLAASYFPRKKNSHYLLNYAFAGAGILDKADNDSIFTLEREIDSYLIANKNQAAAHSLFIVWIGANNYLSIPENPEVSLQEVTTGITHALERLAKAKAKHVLVVNLPDLGTIPAAQQINAETFLSTLSNRHNEILASKVNELRQHYPDVQWIYFDVNRLLNEVMTNPQQYGLDNVKDSCYEAQAATTSSHQAILKMASSIQVKSKKDPCDGYLFFDLVHPTSPAHQLMANKARQVLNLAGINFIP